MSFAFAAALALSLAAKPVAKTYQGPLDGVDVREQSAGVLAHFGHPDRAGAEATLTALSRELELSDLIRVSFIRTSLGALAAIELDAPETRLTFGRITELARRLSAAHGVTSTWAFIAPGPRDASLEQEAFYRFERGAPAGHERFIYREDPQYIAHLRRQSSDTTWHKARWPTYPLSRLAQAVGLPGRGCLQDRWQLQVIAALRWPDDVGENLAYAQVDLPGGMAAEIQQAALKEKVSVSKLVTQAIEAAREKNELGDRPGHERHASYDEGQPDAEKHARRTLTLFLPEASLDAAEDAGGAEALSISRVVQYAWRRAHPVAH
ncbi:MAG: hypothetical protein JNK82_07860 [Myxococcaceae bacterium]|nr:hypothetical protein [Myxococcaceae bacterium]